MKSLKELFRHFAEHPFGPIASFAGVGATLAADFSLPSIVPGVLGFAFFALMVVHWFSEMGPYWLKRCSFGEAVGKMIGPPVVAMVIASGLRVGLMLVLGKPI